MVTSASAGEGKTTTATALAATAQQSGLSTVIVDLDLRRPELHNAIRLEPQAGMLEYLLGEARLDEVVLVDEGSGVSVVPVKRRPKQPANFIRSQRLQEMLQDLRHSYDMIIIDTAPVLPISDSRLLARSVDGVVFVSRWQHTPCDCVGKAHALLALSNEQRVVGVMNDVDLKKYSSYGYMSRGYYYQAYQRYYQH